MQKHRRIKKIKTSLLQTGMNLFYFCTPIFYVSLNALLKKQKHGTGLIGKRLPKAK